MKTQTIENRDALAALETQFPTRVREALDAMSIEQKSRFINEETVAVRLSDRIAMVSSDKHGNAIVRYVAEPAERPAKRRDKYRVPSFSPGSIANAFQGVPC
jgi:hypothetical protein